LAVAIGPRIANELIAELADLPKHAFELRPGLKESLFHIKRTLPAIGAKRVLFLGRQEDPELKGIDVAAEMLKLISTEPAFIGSSALKLIVRGVDPVQSDQVISDMCKKYDIPPHQVLPRFYTTVTNELREDLMSCSLLVMPSRVEGFGLVGLEAISAGIPVLIGQSSGLIELLSQLDRENNGKLPFWKDRVLPVSSDDKANGRVCDFIFQPFGRIKF